jgi:hypothetical protein
MDIYTMTNDGTVYTAHESKFDTYLPVVQRIIDSFTITDGQGESNEED